MTAPDTPRPEGDDPDCARSDDRDAVRRQRRARVFGETLPDATRDERGDGWGARDDRGEPTDEWLRRQVPPHHG